MSHPPAAALRVAITLEQCWHRVPGGTATSVLGVARALAERPDVEVVGVSARHGSPPPEPWTPPIPIRPLPLPRRLLYPAWQYLRRPPVERATGPVDVIHATTFAIPPRSAPLVVTVHDLAFLHEPSHFTRNGLRFFRRGLDLARRHADLVTCPSLDALEDCARHGFARERLRHVPWAADQTVATADEVARVRRVYGLDRPYVLCVGTIEPRKNVPRLIEAFGRLGDPAHDLVLVGPAGWNESLQPHLRGLRRPPKVLGFVPTADLRALYAGADVFCYPSVCEGFGLPVLEAMVQGTPVITSAGTSMAEVTGTAGVLVDPTDTGAIAGALAELLADGDAARALGRSARERAATYTWTRVGEQLAEVYREAAAAGDRR